MKNNNLDGRIEQVYEVYLIQNQFFYHKDNSFNGKSLYEIFSIFSNMQQPSMEGAHYNELEKITEKNGSLVYTFKVIPGHDSIAIKNNHPTEFFHYKIVPKLKLVEGEKQ